MPRAALALLLAIAPACGTGAAPGVATALARCLDGMPEPPALRPHHCPDLADAVAESGLRPWLQPPLDEPPRRDELAALGALLDSLEGPPATGARPRLELLGPILDRTLAPPEGPEAQGWWDRLVAWLEERRSGQDEGGRWLQRLVEALDLGEGAGTWAAYLLVALALLAVLAILLRDPHRLRRGRRRPHGGPGAPESAAAGPYAGAGPSDRSLGARDPPALLRHCIARLAARGRLPDASLGRTNGELLEHLRRHHGPLAAPFQALAAAAERILFGERAPGEDALAGALDAARTLLARAASDRD